MANKQDSTANISWVEEIVERIKSAEGLRFDTEVAPLFGVDKTTIGKWKSRGTIPYEYLINYAQQKGYSLDWLLLGRGPMKIEAFEQVSEQAAAPYRARQIDYTLFNAVAGEVRSMLGENNIKIADEHMQAKVDQLITYIYNSMIKCGEQTVDPEQVRSLIKMIE